MSKAQIPKQQMRLLDNSELVSTLVSLFLIMLKFIPKLRVKQVSNGSLTEKVIMSYQLLKTWISKEVPKLYLDLTKIALNSVEHPTLKKSSKSTVFLTNIQLN